jgi:hypothetical protein
MDGSEELVQQRPLLIRFYGFAPLNNVIMPQKVGEVFLNRVTNSEKAKQGENRQSQSF